MIAAFLLALAADTTPAVPPMTVGDLVVAFAAGVATLAFICGAAWFIVGLRIERATAVLESRVKMLEEEHDKHEKNDERKFERILDELGVIRELLMKAGTT